MLYGWLLITYTMKHAGTKMEFSEERMRDMMIERNKYLASCRHILMPEVYQHLSSVPAPRFYVTGTRAAHVVASMMREGEQALKRMRPLKREMFFEIYSRVLKLMPKHPNTSIYHLCVRVTLQPAPKFYLTPGSIKVLLCRAIKQKKQRA